MFVILLGAPGAGKGTQAEIISGKLGLAHVATGDLFRQAVEKNDMLGRLVKGYMEKGLLVPDEVTIRVLSERLNGPDCRTGCILDGFPRTLEQARALDKTMSERGQAVDVAVYIEVPEAELLKRLSGRWICRKCQAPYHEVSSPPKVAGRCDKCGGELYQRADDKKETVRERLKVYFDQTAPLLDYYSKKGKLARVDGRLAIEEVSGRIMSHLHAGSTRTK